MNVLLFAGAGDGRELAERLADLPLDATVCVASEYGGETMRHLANRFRVRVGRMDEEEMLALLWKGRFGLAVDATHPYAVEVSKNCRAAAERAGVPYLRVLRDGACPESGVVCASHAEAASVCAGLPGNILLATGSKELAPYTAIADFAERVHIRVLPTTEAIAACTGLGFKNNHIVAMHGPFGHELNLAIMKHFAIRVLITKDGGAGGGFAEKQSAAREAGAELVVIGRPPETDGVGLEEALRAIRERLEAEP